MACASKIAAAITNSCTNRPSGGLEPKMWAINRADATFTMDGTTETLAIDAGSSFDVAGNSGFTIEVGDGICEYICSFIDA